MKTPMKGNLLTKSILVITSHFNPANLSGRFCEGKARDVAAGTVVDFYEDVVAADDTQASLWTR